jgi:acetoin utilization deacetylase AcuC-like enzyme
MFDIVNFLNYVAFISRLMIISRFKFISKMSSFSSVTASAAALTVKPIVYYNPWHIFHSLGGRMHPENPKRIKGIIEALDTFIKADAIVMKTFSHEDFKPFEEDPEKPADMWCEDDGDNYRTRYTDSILKISRNMLAAAVEDISKGARCTYVLTRPPGHHASDGIESGFCFENNVWTAVEALLAGGKRRISIYDWDVHHGDGTERCFRAALERDGSKYDDIRFVSSHAYGRGIYPGTGAASADKHIINLPFKKGTDSGKFLDAFKETTLPFVRDCEILIVSAGYDGHRLDPMGMMNLENATYSSMSKRFKDLGVPVLFILEGGYNPEVLGECVRETLMQWM